MVWKQSAAHWPDGAQSLFNELNSFYTASVNNTRDLQNRLDELVPLSIDNSELLNEASGLANIRQALFDRFHFDTVYCSAHPFQHNVGQGENMTRALSAPNAVYSIAQQLRSQSSVMNGSVECVNLLIAAQSLNELRSKLSIVNQVFPMPEALWLENKLDQMLTLETTKFQTKPTKESTRIKPRHSLQNKVMKDIESNLSKVVSQVESVNEDSITPIQELSELLDQKRAMLEDWERAYNLLKNQLNGGALFSAYFARPSLLDLANSLDRSDIPGHEWTHCIALTFIGNPGELSIYRQIFNT